MRGRGIKATAIAAVFGGLMMIAVLPGTADAKKPLAVDCDVLGAALADVDTLLPPGTFDSLGDLIAATKDKDTGAATLGQLNLLLAFVSGGEIQFEDPKAAPSTVAKCGLMSTFVSQVKD